MRVSSFGSVLALILATTAHSADIGVVSKKLLVLDKLAAANKAKVVYVAVDKAAGITKGAGIDAGQIAVRFDMAYANGNAAGAFRLPAGAASGPAGWVVTKSNAAKYKNKDAPGGATDAKMSIVKPGKQIKLVAKGAGDVPIDLFGGGDPGANGVRTAYCVSNQGERNCHCSQFANCSYKPIAKGTGAKMVCKGGPGDATCQAAKPRSVLVYQQFFAVGE